MKFGPIKIFTAAILALGLGSVVAPGSAKAQQGSFFMAQVIPWAGNFAPRGWAFADGQILPIASNTALFSILGTTYGGDGRSTFALPDLRGRAILHPGRGPGLSSYREGERGGVETVTLVETQMPSHSHTASLKASAGAADGTSPSGGALATPLSAMYTEEVDTLDATLTDGSITGTAVGGSLAHNNVQPYVAVNWIIALTGVYPSRN